MRHFIRSEWVGDVGTWHMLLARYPALFRWNPLWNEGHRHKRIIFEARTTIQLPVWRSAGTVVHIPRRYLGYVRLVDDEINMKWIWIVMVKDPSISFPWQSHAVKYCFGGWSSWRKSSWCTLTNHEYYMIKLMIYNVICEIPHNKSKVRVNCSHQ